jgi:hypothetical protein
MCNSGILAFRRFVSESFTSFFLGINGPADSLLNNNDIADWHDIRFAYGDRIIRGVSHDDFEDAIAQHGAEF